MAQTFILSDIHGCLTEFKILVEHLPQQSADHLIFLAHYIDRGPDSRGVVEQILTLQKKYKVTALLGNHEQMFLAFLAAPHSSLGKTFLFNGGLETLANYLAAEESTLPDTANEAQLAAWAAQNLAIPADHLKFLHELKLFYQDEHYFFAHAGAPSCDLNNFDPQEHLEELLWERHNFQEVAGLNYPWDKIIIHGHTPIAKAWRDQQHINLDTGCVYGNKLTCLHLEEMAIYSVACQKDIPSQIPLPSLERAARYWMQRLPVQVKIAEQCTTFTCINYSPAGALLAAPEAFSLLPPQTKLELIFTLPSGECYALPSIVTRREEGDQQVCYGIKFLEKKLPVPARGQAL